MPRGERTRPGDDPSIAALDEGSRWLVATTGARRAALELEGGAAFTAVTQSLVDLRADVRIVDLAARAIAEELRHAAIYGAIARAYGDGGDAPSRATPIAAPHYDGVTPREDHILRVVGMSSINETMACAFLELCLAGTTASFVRDGLREVLEDEIRHARIGWAYLGSPDVGDAERTLVGTWLVPLLRAQWGRWREQIASLPSMEAPAHGCPSPAAIEAAARASMKDLVIPGFAAAGVDVGEARRWLEAGAP
jgi:hypothetical protein